ncbi:MAG: tRNA epoxyqueuosine(34) reductase QueG [Candidatus Sericytochromatia bacterium]
MSTGLVAELKAHAAALGLDRVGVADARPFEAEREALLARAAGPGLNPYEHQDIADRVEPDRLLPGVKAIVAVAMSYAMPEPPDGTDPETLTGWLSMYCRGLDYHQLLEERMGALAAWIEARVPGSRSYVHVDIGPPLDRAVAMRAGLGKFGKSTLLITPGLGTWTFLGEVYTTAALPPDEPLAFNPCGTCTRCLDACPTGALTEWSLDWTRCLGYVNQMDGAVPLEYREVMGDRLFGCDDCQTVCPYNRAAATGLHPEYAPLPGIGARPDLVGLMNLDEPAFDALYGPTAAAWRGLEAVQRNALVALGNTGRAEAIAPLTEALAHDRPLLRRHAAWGLGRLAGLVPAVAAEAQRALLHRQTLESDPDVAHELELALAMIPVPAQG